MADGNEYFSRLLSETLSKQHNDFRQILGSGEYRSSPSHNRNFDVILEATLDNTKVAANRQVLSSCSCFFKELFSKTEENVVFLDCISGPHLYEVVEYSFLEVFTVENMFILMEKLEYFHFDYVHESRCVEFMFGNICVGNCMNVVVAAEKHSKELFLLSMHFIDTFFESAWKLEAFNEISDEILKQILKRNTLKVSNEKLVFDSILKWYKYDKEKRKIFLPGLVKLVRLSELDRTFISSIFLDFCMSNGCNMVVENASKYLLQNEILHRSDKRIVEQIVVFDDKTAHIYNEETGNWTRITSDHNWIWVIERDFSKFSFGIIREVQLTTRQIIFQTKHLNAKLKNVLLIKATDADKYFVVGSKNRVQVLESNVLIKLRCYIYTCQRWSHLHPIYSRNKQYRIAYVNGFLYVIGAQCHINFVDRNLSMCRFNPCTHCWEECPTSLEYLWRYDVDVVDECIYVVGNAIETSISNTHTVLCFNPRTTDWTNVKPLVKPLTGVSPNIKVCGTNLFLYAIEVKSVKKKENGLRRVFRYDPKNDEWKQLDDLNPITANFNVFNASRFN